MAPIVFISWLPRFPRVAPDSRHLVWRPAKEEAHGVMEERT